MKNFLKEDLKRLSKYFAIVAAILVCITFVFPEYWATTLFIFVIVAVAELFVSATNLVFHYYDEKDKENES